MPARKKRPPSPKSAHIAVQSQVSSLEEEQPVVKDTKSHSDPSPVVEKPDITTQSSTPQDMPPQEVSLEAMLANDATESELSKKNIWVYRFGLMVTGVIIVLSIGIYTLYLQSSKTPVANTMPSITPTPVPAIAVDPKSISIEVFNASGVAGKASKTAEALKAKGYSIAATGNAKKIPGTTVIFASALSDRAKEMVLTDLQSMGISSISSMLGDSSVSARITLGLK